MTPVRTSVLLIVDAAADAAAINGIMSADTGFEVASIAPTSHRLAEKLRTLRPAAVILGTPPTTIDGARLIRRIARRDRPPGIVVVTATPDTASLLTAFKAGADAYLSMSAIHASLIPALSAVRQRRVYFSRMDASAIRRHMNRLDRQSSRRSTDARSEMSALTTREAEIFPLLADGRSVKSVARLLGLSPKTVETHKYHIFEKLNVATIADLTRLAIRKKLIPP